MNQSILCLVLLPLLASASVRAETLDFGEAAQVIIQYNGRKKPLDTFATESLQDIYGRRSLKDPAAGQSRPALDVLLSLWFAPDQWKGFPLILVSGAALRSELGLGGKEGHVSFKAVSESHAFGELARRVHEKRTRNEELMPLEREAETVLARIDLLSAIFSGEAFAIVPDPVAPKGRWLTVPLAGRAYPAEAASGLMAALKRVSETYQTRDRAGFRESSVALRERLRNLAPAVYPPPALIRREIHYNHFHPFRWAWTLYLAAFFLLLWPRTGRVGLGVFAGGLACNIYGFVLRCLIAGRPPVTNMYESVVWVAMGVAAFALVFELVYRVRVFALSAAPLAMLGLIIADMLPSVLSPSIGPLPPVLRDNFWLMAHVLTITSSYAAFAVAMGVAHFILGRYLFKPSSVDENSPLHFLLYRMLQLGVFLLAIGTVLGGVWANYAWGRFWGWDPKETWAAISLLLYIFALHGRMVRWWGSFGLSVAAVVCFNGVLMAWYGVNFVLASGLHSYGFGGGGAGWVCGLVALDLAFVAACGVAGARRNSQRV